MTLHLTVYGAEPDEAALLDELAPRLGVTPRIIEAAASEANAHLARGSRCVSIGHKSPVCGGTLVALRRAGVRYLSTRSIGYNHLDLNLARSLGIQVENVAYSPDSVADYTLMLILMLLRDTRSTLSRAEQHDYRLSDARGRELRDLTVGVVGTGRIGAAVLDRLRGFGSRLLAHDTSPSYAVERGVEYVALDELLRRCDVVTLHTPLTEATHHLLDRRRLERVIRPGALVVNTGRGGLLDTTALLDALRRGRVGGAALDVLEREEGIFYTDRRGRPVGSELRQLQALPNVIITPHTAYYTDHALRDTVENSLRNCLAFETTGETTGETTDEMNDEMGSVSCTG